MSIVDLKCPFPSCPYSSGKHEAVAAAALLNAHTLTYQLAPVPLAPTTARAPKLVRPKVKSNITGEEWNAFTRRWSTYRTGSGISDADAPSQLLECTTEDLGDIILRAHPDFTNQAIADALRLLKSLAVVHVALGVLRSQLSKMIQGPDEAFRTYTARVQGKAETCEFRTAFNGRCSNCNTAVTGSTYYTDEVIKDVLLNGIADSDIRREALSTEGMLAKSINQIVAFVE